MAAISEPATYSGPNGAVLSPYGQGFTRRSAALSFDRATKEADVPGQSVRQHRVGRDAKQAQIAANSCPSTERTMGGFNDRWDASEDAGVAPLTRNKRSVWTIPIVPYSGYSQSVRWGDVEADAVGGDIQRTESPDCPVHVGLPVPAAIPSDGGRGIASPSSFRSLGMFDGPAPEPQGAPGSHFATFPPKLVEPMILAGSKPGDVILDPFGGSGTVGQVAQMHSRRAVLIDLNPDYLAQQMQRCAQSPLGLESVS
jgi:hypothetical protein